jgi:UDP-glucuronate 4-epimerase
MSQPAYLITGAAGFIGSHLVESLLREGEEVIGLDNFDEFYDPAIKRRNLQWAMTQPNFKLVQGDVRDGELMDELFDAVPIDCVYHLAARAGVRPSIQNPLLYQSVNVEGTATLLEAMRRNNVGRLLFASSSSVYGNNPSVPFRETDNVDRPISPYAATKKACELLCYTYHHLFGMDVACLRFFTVYGPRQRPEMAIHNFTRMIAEGEELPMYGDGSTARDYTYIDDIIQGLRAIEKNFSGYHILNLGESETTTLRRLIEMISESLDCKPHIRQLPLQPGDVELTCADITAARALGYQPTTPIREGIGKFVAWFRQQLVEAGE